jgi:hypothetical protein
MCLKSEEGFGDDGADWEVYRAMDMQDSDSGMVWWLPDVWLTSIYYQRLFIHHPTTAEASMQRS